MSALSDENRDILDYVARSKGTVRLMITHNVGSYKYVDPCYNLTCASIMVSASYPGHPAFILQV